jgi:hypothetical protein
MLLEDENCNMSRRRVVEPSEWIIDIIRESKTILSLIVTWYVHFKLTAEYQIFHYWRLFSSPTKYCIIVNKSLCSARKSTLTHDRIKQNLPFPQGTPLQYLVTNNTRQKLEDVIRRMAMLAWG